MLVFGPSVRRASVLSGAQMRPPAIQSGWRIAVAGAPLDPLRKQEDFKKLFDELEKPLPAKPDLFWIES